MTYNEFISKYNGSRIDYDGCAGVQCVDLARLYSIKVLECDMGPTPTGYAVGYYTNPTSAVTKLFTLIANTASFVPKKGDLMVWSANLNGKAGHIALCTGEGNTSYYYSYDYNWKGINDGWTKIKHDYSCVLGVLRPKDQAKVLGTATKPAAKILDTTGYKLGDKNTAVLALKQLIRVGRLTGVIPAGVEQDNDFDNATKNAVNKALAKWGYAQNGIAGKNFINKLGHLVEPELK